MGDSYQAYLNGVSSSGPLRGLLSAIGSAGRLHHQIQEAGEDPRFRASGAGTSHEDASGDMA